MVDGLRFVSFLGWRKEDEDNEWESFPICCVVNSHNARPLKRVFDRRTLDGSTRATATHLCLVKPDEDDDSVWWVRQNHEGENRTYRRYNLDDLVYHEEDCTCISRCEDALDDLNEEARKVHSINNRTSMKVPKEQTVYDKYVVDDLVYDPAREQWTSTTETAAGMLEQMVGAEGFEDEFDDFSDCGGEIGRSPVQTNSSYFPRRRISRSQLFRKKSEKEVDINGIMERYKSSFEYFQVRGRQKAQEEFNRCLSGINIAQAEHAIVNNVRTHLRSMHVRNNEETTRGLGYRVGYPDRHVKTKEVELEMLRKRGFLIVSFAAEIFAGQIEPRSCG